MHRVRFWIVAASIAAVHLFHARAAAAQQTQTNQNANLARRFFGVGVMGGTNDAADRVQVPNENASGILLVEADLVRAGRAALGVEFASFGKTTGSTNALCCLFEAEQSERSLLAMVRGRAWTSGRVALDGTAGAGVLFEHIEAHSSLRFVPNSATDVIENRRAPVLAAGVDLPLLLAPHLSVAPMARLYFLRRETIDTAVVAQSSSRRFAVGASGRVLW